MQDYDGHYPPANEHLKDEADAALAKWTAWYLATDADRNLLTEDT